MSTYVGFRCRTCEEDSERPYNRGYDLLEQIWQLRHPIFEITTAAYYGVRVELAGDGNNLIDFIHEHHEHDVCIVDEYGHETELKHAKA